MPLTDTDTVPLTSVSTFLDDGVTEVRVGDYVVYNHQGEDESIWGEHKWEDGERVQIVHIYAGGGDCRIYLRHPDYLSGLYKGFGPWTRRLTASRNNALSKELSKEIKL